MVQFHSSNRLERNAPRNKMHLFVELLYSHLSTLKESLILGSGHFYLKLWPKNSVPSVFAKEFSTILNKDRILGVFVLGLEWASSRSGFYLFSTFRYKVALFLQFPKYVLRVSFFFFLYVFLRVIYGKRLEFGTNVE